MRYEGCRVKVSDMLVDYSYMKKKGVKNAELD